MRIYLDANVMISVLLQEIGREFRPLFIEAEKFFDKVISEDHTLVLSELFFYEVEKRTSYQKESILSYLKELNMRVELPVEPLQLNAREIEKQGVHYPDSKHAALAMYYKCDCIMTFNMKDFEPIQNRIRVIEPNQFG